MVGTLPVAPVQLPIFRSRTYIRFNKLDSSLNNIEFSSIELDYDNAVELTHSGNALKYTPVYTTTKAGICTFQTSGGNSTSYIQIASGKNISDIDVSDYSPVKASSQCSNAYVSINAFIGKGEEISLRCSGLNNYYARFIPFK